MTSILIFFGAAVVLGLATFGLCRWERGATPTAQNWLGPLIVMSGFGAVGCGIAGFVRLGEYSEKLTTAVFFGGVMAFVIFVFSKALAHDWPRIRTARQKRREVAAKPAAVRDGDTIYLRRGVIDARELQPVLDSFTEHPAPKYEPGMWQREGIE